MHPLALCLVLPSLIAAYPSVANLPNSPCPAHTVICADGDGLSSRYLKCVQGAWAEAFCPATHLCVGSKGPTVFCAASEPMPAVVTAVERLSTSTHKPLPNASPSQMYLHQYTPPAPQSTPAAVRVPLLAPMQHPVSVPPLDLARNQNPIWMLTNTQRTEGVSSLPAQDNESVQRPAVDLARNTGPVWLFSSDASALDNPMATIQAADSMQSSAPAPEADSAMSRPPFPEALNSAPHFDANEHTMEESLLPRVLQQMPEDTQLGGMDADKVVSVIASFIISHSSEPESFQEPSNFGNSLLNAQQNTQVITQVVTQQDSQPKVVTATDFVTGQVSWATITSPAPVSSTPNVFTIFPVIQNSLHPSTVQMQSSLPPSARAVLTATAPANAPQKTPVAPMVVPAKPVSSARAAPTQSQTKQNVVPYIPFRIPRSCRPGEFICEAHGLRPGYFACDAGGLALPAACAINEVCYQYGRSILCDVPGGTTRNP